MSLSLLGTSGAKVGNIKISPFNKCPDCAYSLVGMDPPRRCPECGWNHLPESVVLFFGWRSGIRSVILRLGVFFLLGPCTFHFLDLLLGRNAALMAIGVIVVAALLTIASWAVEKYSGRGFFSIDRTSVTIKKNGRTRVIPFSTLAEVIVDDYPPRLRLEFEHCKLAVECGNLRDCHFLKSVCDLLQNASGPNELHESIVQRIRIAFERAFSYDVLSNQKGGHHRRFMAISILLTAVGMVMGIGVALFSQRGEQLFTGASLALSTIGIVGILYGSWKQNRTNGDFSHKMRDGEKTSG